MIWFLYKCNFLNLSHFNKCPLTCFTQKKLTLSTTKMINRFYKTLMKLRCPAKTRFIKSPVLGCFRSICKWHGISRRQMIWIPLHHRAHCRSLVDMVQILLWVRILLVSTHVHTNTHIYVFMHLGIMSLFK